MFASISYHPCSVENYVLFVFFKSTDPQPPSDFQQKMPSSYSLCKLFNHVSVTYSLDLKLFYLLLWWGVLNRNGQTPFVILSDWLFFHLSSPTLDSVSVSQAQATKDPPDVLDKQKCLDALAALRHAKWFQVWRNSSFMFKSRQKKIKCQIKLYFSALCLSSFNLVRYHHLKDSGSTGWRLKCVLVSWYKKSFKT